MPKACQKQFKVDGKRRRSSGQIRSKLIFLFFLFYFFCQNGKRSAHDPTHPIPTIKHSNGSSGYPPLRIRFFNRTQEYKAGNGNCFYEVFTQGGWIQMHNISYHLQIIYCLVLNLQISITCMTAPLI